MNKRKLILLGSIALVVIVATVYIVRGLQTQTFAYANLMDPDYNLLVIEELNIYSEEEDAMIPIKIRGDDKERLNELMLTTKVSKYPVKEPSSVTLIAEQKFRDALGANLSFTLHTKNNNYYVAVPADIYIEQIEWYKLKSTEIPDFFIYLLEKSDL